MAGKQDLPYLERLSIRRIYMNEYDSVSADIVDLVDLATVARLSPGIPNLRGTNPFALIVDPVSIKAAADRVAQLGLPRLLVKAFSDKDKSGPFTRSSRRAAARR